MKHFAGIAITIFLLAGMLGLGGAAQVSAATACQNSGNPLSCACSISGASAAAACSPNPKTDPITGSKGIIHKTTLIIATIAGIAAVIIVIIGGFMLVTANGDSQKVVQARTAIISAFVGLVLIAIATSIVIFVMGRIG